MARRRSLNRRSSRRSSFYRSRVLINDSEYIDDDDETYWRHIPDQTKYSIRSNTSEPALNPNSEFVDDSEDSEWWGNLQETGKDFDKIDQNADGFAVNESSIKVTENISVSTSASESHQRSTKSKKRRVQLGQNRKSLGRNPFSQILDESVESEPLPSTSAQYKALQTSSLSLNQLENRRSTTSRTRNKNTSKYSPGSATTSPETERRVKRRPSLFKRVKRASLLSFSELLEEGDSFVGSSQHTDVAKTNANADKSNVSLKNLAPPSPSKNKSTISHKNSEEGGNITANFDTQQRSPYDKLKNISSRNRTTNIINNTDRELVSHEQEKGSVNKTLIARSSQDINKSLKHQSNDATDQSKASQSIENQSSTLDGSRKSTRRFTIQISDSGEEGIYEIENDESEDELTVDPSNEGINTQNNVQDDNLINNHATDDRRSASQQSRESPTRKNKFELDDRNNKSNRRVSEHITEDDDENDKQVFQKSEKRSADKVIIATSSQDSDKSLKDKSNDAIDPDVSVHLKESKSSKNRSSKFDKSRKSSRRFTIQVSDDESEKDLNEMENNESDDELLFDAPSNSQISDLGENSRDNRPKDNQNTFVQSRKSRDLRNKSAKISESNKSSRRDTQHSTDNDIQKTGNIIDENESDEELFDRRSIKSGVGKHPENNAIVDNVKNISTKTKKSLPENKTVDLQREESSELSEDEKNVKHRSRAASIDQRSVSTRVSKSDSDNFNLRLSNDEDYLANNNKDESENSPRLKKKPLNIRQLKRSSRVSSTSSESIQESFRLKNPSNVANISNTSISNRNKAKIDLETEKENLESFREDFPAMRESQSSKKEVSLSELIPHKNTRTTLSRKSSTESLTESIKSTRYRLSQDVGVGNKSNENLEMSKFLSRQISNEISGINPLKSSQDSRVSVEDVSNDRSSETLRNVSLRRRRAIERQMNVHEESVNVLNYIEVERDRLASNEDRENTRASQEHRKSKEKRRNESSDDASDDGEEISLSSMTKSMKKRKTDAGKPDLEVKERTFSRKSDTRSNDKRKTTTTIQRNEDKDDELYSNQQEISSSVHKSKQSMSRINAGRTQEIEEEEKGVEEEGGREIEGNSDIEMNEDNVGGAIDQGFDPSAYELPEQERSGSISESDIDHCREVALHTDSTKHQSKSKTLSNELNKKSNKSPQPGPSGSKQHNKSTKKPLDVDAILSSQKMVDLQERLKKIKQKTDKAAEREIKLLEKKPETVMKTFPIFKNVKNRGNFNKKQNSLKPNDKPPTPKPVHRAYIVNGKVYKPPKLPRPQKWVTDRLYKYLWKKLEPKYDHRTRVKSEKFVMYLSDIVKVIRRRKKYENYKDDLNALLKTMAKLGIIETRLDFNHFCHDFMPFEFRDKVISRLMPGNVHNIPFHPETLTVPILRSENSEN